MIAKEHQAPPTTDGFKQAGDKAESQMAFYLRRAFGDHPQVFVFNNLRLEHAGEVAQLDHLIVHKGGMVIVESKSVTSAVRINDREEWARQWNGHWQGMASPVLQAQRQADLLRKCLQAHSAELLNRSLFGKQAGFGTFVIDVVVAISDAGVIEAHGDRPEVRKADQVPQRVQELIRDHASLSNPLSLRFDKRAWQEGFNLVPDQLARVIAFLQGSHVEAPVAVTEPPATPTAMPVFACSKCQSTQLQIQFGKSYYFKCLSCGGNTAIRLNCAKCGAQARTRKNGREFFADCQQCGHSEQYFVNP